MSRMQLTPTSRRRALLEAVPLVCAIVALAIWQIGGAYASQVRVRLTPVEVDSAAELAASFDALDYAWPPAGPVPPLAAVRLPKDVDRLNAAVRKQLFFRALLPLVLAENLAIRRQRQFLESAFTAEYRLDHITLRRIYAIARQYQVEGDVRDPAFRELLLRRVDEVPPALALAQAANESGWGTSRFAQQANNLFGHWTWNPRQGLVPLERKAGARHRVRIFGDLRAAVRTYLHNLNVGRAYVDLRVLRARMRADGQPLDPIALAGGLRRYSERGTAYVREIRALIRSNALHEMRGEELALME